MVIIQNQRHKSNTPVAQTTTRGKCEGTLHRLTPMGKSTSPIHQTGQCHNHTNQKNQNTVNPTWELAQSRDQRGVNNFHQDPNGKIITTNTGKPYCNYCQLPYHSRQRCAFRLGDLKNDIDRQVHPRKAKNYTPANRRHRSPMSTRLVKETDRLGHSRFLQTLDGNIIYSIVNQPQCSYCGIPSHGRDTCPHRRIDKAGGLFRIHHPQRGLIYQTEHTQPGLSYTSTTIGHSNSKDAQGVHNYQLTNNKYSTSQVIPYAIIGEYQVTLERDVRLESRTK